MVGKIYSCWSNTTQIEESTPIPASSLGKGWDQTLTLLKHRLSSLPSLKLCRFFKRFILLGRSYFEYQCWSYTNGFFSPFFFFQQSYNKGIRAREAAQMFCLLEPSRHNLSKFEVVVKERVKGLDWGCKLFRFWGFFLRSFIMRTLVSVIKAPSSLIPSIRDILILWSYLFDFWRIKKKQQAKLLFFLRIMWSLVWCKELPTPPAHSTLCSVLIVQNEGENELFLSPKLCTALGLSCW